MSRILIAYPEWEWQGHTVYQRVLLKDSGGFQWMRVGYLKPKKYSI